MEAKDILFINGINTDDDPRLIQNGDYRMSTYCRSGSAESQNQGALESMPGNLLVNNLNLPAGVNTVIGSAKWIKGNSIIYFVHNSNNLHTIWSFDINTSVITLVLGNLAVGNAGEALNFQIDHKIYHTNVVDDLLYWTDGYFDDFLYDGNGVLQFNPPRKIDIPKAIKYMSTAGLDPDGYPVEAFDTIDHSFHTMDALKCPPTYKPLAAYQTNLNKSFNKLYGKQYQFRYQYVYNNNEESKWSMISNQPFSNTNEYVSGRDTEAPLTDNEIIINYYTGQYDVTKIRFAVRVGENGAWSIFQEIDKEQALVTDEVISTVIYDGNVATKPAAATQYNYDSMPQVAKCQEIISNNSITYGNYYADYDLLENIDMSITANLENVDYLARPYINEVVIGNQSNNSQPWEIDPFGQVTGTGCFIHFTSGTDFFFTFEFVEGDLIVFPLYDLTTGPSSLINYYYKVTAADIAYVGNPVDKLLNLANSVSLSLIADGIPNTVNGTTAGNIYLDVPDYWTGQGDGTIYVHQCKILRENKCVKSLKKGSTKVFGIQYYDRGLRSGSVQYKASQIIPLQLDVPFPANEDLSFLTQPGNPYTVKAQVEINHTPPEWATHYQILVKKDELMINFQQRSIMYMEVLQDGFTFKMSLENFYTNRYKGTSINHTPQKGDIVRFVAKAPVIQPNPPSTAGYEQPEYCDVYYETEILEYEPAGGVDRGYGPSEAIIVAQFDYSQIFDGISGFVGALVEIYTPKPQEDDEIWYEIQDPSENYNEGYVILNPHTANRTHAGNTQDQTALQPAIIDLDYGDVYVRARNYFTGYEEPIFDTFNDFPGIANTEAGVLFRLYREVQTAAINKVYYFLGGTGGVSSTGYYLLYNQDLFNVSPMTGYYWVEDYSYSDYYKSDSHGLGRFGLDDINAKRRNLTSSVIHSLPYVQNSFINGLSSFEGLGNSLYLNDNFGSINRLKQVGYTLKALQNRKETSIYIQKSYATGGDGSGQLAYTDKVFGGVNPYDSLFGTVHPGSVQLIEGELFYFDLYTGAFIKTSSNGQSDISSGQYKFNYWTSNKATEITADTTEYDVTSMIDESNMEYTCFFGFKDGTERPRETEGVVFSYLRNRWITMVDYNPMWAETLGVVNVSWNANGQLYVHNEGDELEFYGLQKTQSVTFVMNESGTLIKRPLTLGLRSNAVFNVDSVKTYENESYPIMETEMPSTLLSLKEGYYWAAYLRDKLNTNVADPYLATTALALQNGRQLRGYAFEHTISQNTDKKVVLFSAKVVFVPSPALI